jgi:PAS domain S-box-containing protein
MMPEWDGCLALLNRVYHTGEPESHTDPDGSAPHPLLWSYTIWPVPGDGERRAGVMLQVTETTKFHQRSAEMSEALMLRSVRQHELAEANDLLITQLQEEISQRRRAEDALRASELSYRRLFEAAEDGILILEADTGRISDVNPFLIKLLGFSRSEMVGKTVGELSPFKDIESNRVMLERLQKDGYVRYEDLPLETKDGRHAAVEFVTNVYQAGDKKVIQCNIRDITERKAAEIALIRLGAIVEFSEDAIIGKDLNSIITSWNKGAEKIFGHTASEIVGSSIMRLLPADRQDEENQILRKIKRGESVKQFETPRQAKDGRLIDVSVTISPIKDATGKVIGMSKVARDITERKRADHELVAAKNEISRHAIALEETVTQRTAQLRETIGELEAFSYSISHDLRAPLRAMRGFAEILSEEHSARLDAEGIKYLGKIHAAAGRMDNLIQDVLTYTRVLRAEVKIKPVDLDALVRQIIGTYPQLQTGDVEIQIEGVLPKVLGGEASLAQCISNLLTNAVKFVAPETKPRVKIRAEAIAADIRLWVQDNGIGIAPQDQVRIFKMFERVHRATAYEGTGIGLAIVRKAVERMGGQMGVESEVGQGSKFWVQLKAANL